MGINKLEDRTFTKENEKTAKAHSLFKKLLKELEKKEIPDRVLSKINQEIYVINAYETEDKQLKKLIKSKQSQILKLLQKELKLTTKNHYRNMWTALGMTVFGIPFGVAFGTALENMAFLGIGLPIGLVMGMAIGSGLDKKALEEGRQLDVTIEP